MVSPSGGKQSDPCYSRVTLSFAERSRSEQKNSLQVDPIRKKAGFLFLEDKV